MYVVENEAVSYASRTVSNSLIIFSHLNKLHLDSAPVKSYKNLFHSGLHHMISTGAVAFYFLMNSTYFIHQCSIFPDLFLSH